MSRKNPTIAEALAAGTKITFAPQFVADIVAIRSTDIEAWSRSRWISMIGKPHKIIGGKALDSQRQWKTQAGWCSDKRRQMRPMVTMVRDLTVDQLLDLVDGDRADAEALAAECSAAARRCVAPVAAAA